METTPRTNATALDAYIDAQRQARTLLEQLTAHLDAHQESLIPEQIHWGHVGDINAIVGRLEELVHNR